MNKYILLLSMLMVASTVSASIVKFDEYSYSFNSGHDEQFDKNNKKNKNSEPHGWRLPAVANERRGNAFNHSDFFRMDDFSHFAQQHDNRSFDVRRPDFTDLFHEFTHRERHDDRHLDFGDHFPNHDFYGDGHGFGHGHDYSGGGFEHGQCNIPDPVPVPAAAWLFMSGLAGLLRRAHRRRT